MITTQFRKFRRSFYHIGCHSSMDLESRSFRRRHDRQRGDLESVRVPISPCWPDAQSVLFAGGGLKMGQVVGATNARAEYPTQRPLTPKDILATIYQHLGIDSRHNFLDH